MLTIAGGILLAPILLAIIVFGIGILGFVFEGIILGIEYIFSKVITWAIITLVAVVILAANEYGLPNEDFWILIQAMAGFFTVCFTAYYMLELDE